MGRNRESSEGKQTLLEEPRKDYGTEANISEDGDQHDNESEYMSIDSGNEHIVWNCYVISKVACLFLAVVVIVSIIQWTTLHWDKPLMML